MSEILDQQLEKLKSDLKDVRPAIQARLFFLSQEIGRALKIEESGIPLQINVGLDRWPEWDRDPAPEGIINVEVLHHLRGAEMGFEIIVQRRQPRIRVRLHEEITSGHEIKIYYCKALALFATHLNVIEELAADKGLAELLERESKLERELNTIKQAMAEEEDRYIQSRAREAEQHPDNLLIFKKLIRMRGTDGTRYKNIASLRFIDNGDGSYFVQMTNNHRGVMTANISGEEMARVFQLRDIQASK